MPLYQHGDQRIGIICHRGRIHQKAEAEGEYDGKDSGDHIETVTVFEKWDKAHQQHGDDAGKHKRIDWQAHEEQDCKQDIDDTDLCMIGIGQKKRHAYNQSKGILIYQAHTEFST